MEMKKNDFEYMTTTSVSGGTLDIDFNMMSKAGWEPHGSLIAILYNDGHQFIQVWRRITSYKDDASMLSLIRHHFGVFFEANHQPRDNFRKFSKIVGLILKGEEFDPDSID